MRSLISGAGGQSWRQLVTRDLNCLRIALAPLLDELGEAGANVAAWSDFVRAHVPAWKRYIRAYLALPATDAETAAEDFEDADGWMRGACTRVFASLAALRAHRQRVHGDRGGLRLRYSGSRCPHCASEFHTRLRLLTHLRVGARACTSAAANSVRPLLPPAVVLAGDEADAKVRREARRLGTFAQAGPPVRRHILVLARDLATCDPMDCEAAACDVCAPLCISSAFGVEGSVEEVPIIFGAPDVVTCNLRGGGFSSAGDALGTSRDMVAYNAAAPDAVALDGGGLCGLGAFLAGGALGAPRDSVAYNAAAPDAVAFGAGGLGGHGGSSQAVP